jgi:hypothetical protein
MDKSNLDYFTEGLDIVAKVIRTLLVSTLKKHYGEYSWWTAGIAPKINPDDFVPKGATYDEKIANADFSFLAKVLSRSSRDADFSSIFSVAQFTYLHEISNTRNATFHSADGIGSIDDVTAERALDTMYLFIKGIPGYEDQATHLNDLEKEISQKNTLTSKPAGGNPEITSIPSWRFVVTPRKEIAEGTDLSNNAFALNLSSLVSGKQGADLPAPISFFDRTYLTNGIKLLLKAVAQRINGNGTTPVIEVRTSFGGGKTHSMLAAYYMVRDSKQIKDLKGVTSLLNEAGISSLPENCATAVVVGTDLSTTTARKAEGSLIKTIWGEIAYQLYQTSGKPEAFEVMKKNNLENGTPTTSEFKAMLEKSGPTLIIIDELVAYARKLDGTNSIGGDFESFLTGMQALTEAVCESPRAILVCSIPESEAELGGERGKAVAASLKKVFSRVALTWQTAEEDESFNIVRRRIFNDPSEDDEKKIRGYCQKYIEMYRGDSSSLFGTFATQTDLLDKMVECYPFHPLVFDLLYKKWGSLENFQRTRSVLSLLSTAVNYFWNSSDQSPLITPGNFPIDCVNIKTDLINKLQSEAWNSVIDTEFNTRGSIAVKLDNGKADFGKLNACKKISTAIFLGSVPSSSSRGLQDDEIFASVASPNDSGSYYIYKNALDIIKKSSSHINENGATYWFDTAPSINKVIETIRSQITGDEIHKALQKYAAPLFRGDFSVPLEINTWPASSADIPDDRLLRLAILSDQMPYSEQSISSLSKETFLEFVRKHGEANRINRNRLLLLAPDSSLIQEAQDEIKTELALERAKADETLTQMQLNSLKVRIKNTENEISNSILSAYKWVLKFRALDESDLDKIDIVPLEITPGSNMLQTIFEALKRDDTLVPKLAPSSLIIQIQKYYFNSQKECKPLKIDDLYNDFCKFLFLPKITSLDVLTSSVDEEITSSGPDFGYCSSLNEKGEPSEVYISINNKGYTSAIKEGYILESHYALSLLPKIPPKPDQPIPPEPPFGTQGGHGGTTPPHVAPDEPLPNCFILNTDIPVDGKSVSLIASYFRDVIGNLGDNVQVKISIEAENDAGYDSNTKDTIETNCVTLGAKEHLFYKK